MATVRKQASDGKVIIECTQEEFESIFWAVQSTYEAVFNSKYSAPEDLANCEKLRNDLGSFRRS